MFNHRVKRSRPSSSIKAILALTQNWHPNATDFRCTGCLPWSGRFWMYILETWRSYLYIYPGSSHMKPAVLLSQTYEVHSPQKKRGVICWWGCRRYVSFRFRPEHLSIKYLRGTFQMLGILDHWKTCLATYSNPRLQCLLAEVLTNWPRRNTNRFPH